MEIAHLLQVRRSRTAHGDAIPLAFSLPRAQGGIGELPKSVELVGVSALRARHPVGAVHIRSRRPTRHECASASREMSMRAA